MAPDVAYPERRSTVTADPGHEFSGLIEEIAPGVTGLAAGVAVYGLNNWFKDGAAAEYCVTTASEMAPKPQTIDHLQTAVVPISGLTAWPALFDHGKIEAGQKVLIHGGAGGVGILPFSWPPGRVFWSSPRFPRQTPNSSEALAPR